MRDGMAFHSRWLVFVASAIAVLAAACGAAEENQPGRARGGAVPLPGVGVSLPFGNRNISSVAVGEGAVWVASCDAASASVSRIDPERNEVVATIAVRGDVQGVAAGEGAVWVVGGTCGERLPEDPDVCRLDLRVSRIDPRSNEEVATIPLDPPPGLRSPNPLTSWVAAGEGGVWVSVGWDPWTGEVVRIDPHTNQVVARIDARGSPGEVAVGADAVWVLSDPAFTDESFGRASLHRIDPRSNEIAATPLREELSHIGGTVIPPTLAVGPDAVWIRSYKGHIPLAVRVDARTGEVARRRLSHFSPVAVTEDGVWFIGADFARLNSGTSEVERLIELGAAFGQGLTPGDAAFDPEARSLWIAALAVRRGKQTAILRIDLP
jgi:hypothetical protein